MEWDSTFLTVAKRYGISVTTVQDVFDRYVNPKRGTLPEVLSIDECYNCNLFNDPYSCILLDWKEKRCIDIIMDRSKKSISSYFSKITKEERDKVKYIVMDMWQPYADVAKIYFPKAIIAIDSFHVMQNIGRAVDNVRNRIRSTVPNGTEDYFLLKKYNYLLFSNPAIWEEKVKDRRLKKWVNQRQVLDMILAINKDLKKAHEFYIGYKQMNKECSFEQVKDRFIDFSSSLEVATIPEFGPVLGMLQNWEEYIINSFICYEERRLSNGPIEGFNSNFKKTITVSNGYGNFSRFRNKLMFCYNKKLKLSPVEKTISKIQRRKTKKGKRKPRQNA